MKINEQLSMLLLLEKSKTGKDGKTPITIRLTVESKRAELSLGIKVHLNIWNQDSGTAKGNSIEAQAINTSIERARAKLRKCYDLLAAQHDHVSSAMVKAAYLGKDTNEEKPVSKSLVEAIDFVIDKMTKKVEKNQVDIPKKLTISVAPTVRVFHQN